MNARKASDQRHDIYREVTDRIVKLLERGVSLGLPRWSGAALSFPLRQNGQRYRGVNVLLLWATAMERGYGSPYWMTYRQALALGGQVKRDERGTMTVFYGVVKGREEAEDVEQDADEQRDQSREFRLLKFFHVFNAEQIEGLPARYYVAPPAPMNAGERLPELERFVQACGARMDLCSTRASYSMSEDLVRMPPFERFRTPELYYATLTHELTHWTRHPSRLNRDFGQKVRGDAGYAKEELVAEIGSAFLGAELGLPPEHIEDHAAYVDSWLKALKDDKRLIFAAAAKAQQAADFLLTLGGRALRAAA